MEEEHATVLRYAETTKINSTLFDHTGNGDTHYAVRLNGAEHERIGLAKSLAVMTGDTVRAEVYAKYLDPDPSNWTAALQNLMAAIAGGTAPTGTVIEAVPPVGGDGFPFAGLLDAAKAGDTGTRAYLNILLFDESLGFLDAAFVPVSMAAREDGTNVPHEKLSGEIVVQQPGYAYIYLSNDNDQPLEVFFDDFTVTHSHSAIVQADDYYPFGLTFNGYRREDGMMNRYLYNGKELQDDLDLRWYDYGARMYMPDLGRFGAMDPLTDLMVSWSPYHYTYNNPINFTDPSGMLPADRLGGWSKDFNQGFPEWGRQAIFDDRKPCICGSSNNGDGTNNGGGDDKIYEGKPLGEVTVSANKMSELDKMRYDTGKDPITRSYLNGTTPRGRKISFGEGLGYQTEFWQGMQTLGKGFTYAFGGLLVAPYAGTLLGGYSAATVPATTYSVTNYVTTLAYIKGNGLLAAQAGALSVGLSNRATRILQSSQVRLLRINYPWLRNPISQAGRAVQNIKLLPSRGEPHIPLDPRSPWSALYNLYKSTPEN